MDSNEKLTHAELNSWVYKQLTDALAALQYGKPNDRSDADRRYAITITEMEKVVAYFETWVVNG